ncbi:MAG TPA: nucleotide exchange factor GrpE [Chloroflexota bacterium]|nr:nucleotide exchange factor GrpE [Chloroflexota bacterium]
MEQSSETRTSTEEDAVGGGTQEPEAQEVADPSSLAVELDEARRQAEENYDKFLRAHADMENYKKRIERTYADLARNSKKDLLLKLLGVKDNLERALTYGSDEAPGQNESVIQGVRLTEYQLDQLLRAEGVVPMELVGKPFNPEQADALSTVVDPAVPDHTIVNEVQRGYLYQDQVLRPAKVVVAVHQTGEQV